MNFEFSKTSSTSFQKNLKLMWPSQVEKLEAAVFALYAGLGDESAPFHGWPHLEFVRAKALEFARRNGADLTVVSICALVHDLNYLVVQNSLPSDGRQLRYQLLKDSGLTDQDCHMIESVVEAAHTGIRGPKVSAEVAALSDADTLFKVLPITPIALSHRYRLETGLSLELMARKIVSEQAELVARGIYFYDADVERTYGHWARTNLAIWQHLLESFHDPDVRKLMEQMGIR